LNLQFDNINTDYIPIIEDGIRQLMKQFKIIGILLFGSLAKKREKPFAEAISDVDLIILINSLPPVKERLRLLRTMPINPRLRVILQTPLEIKKTMTSTGWLMDALASGKIIYDPSHHLKSLIEEFHRRLQQKHIVETADYWDRPIKLGEKIEL